MITLILISVAWIASGVFFTHRWYKEQSQYARVEGTLLSLRWARVLCILSAPLILVLSLYYWFRER